MKLNRYFAVALLAAAPASCGLVSAADAGRNAAPIVVAGSVPVSTAELDRGRYLVRVGGCNDCHTANYAASAGQVPEAEWLLGDSTAYEGAWGTSFATNLRLTMQRYNDQDWLTHARSFAARPPMPWFTMHAMSDQDLLAVLRFVQWLGPKGEPAPAALPPGESWIGPVVRYSVTATAP